VSLPRGALVAGASFAGLAVGRELGPRALLVDPDEIGEGQTSACGAPIRVLEALGAAGATQAVHHDLVIHTPGREIRWPLPEPFCTFEYRACCRAAFAGSGARYLRASVRGRCGASVAVTSAGDLTAGVLVDATGWRASLARPSSDAAARGRLTGTPTGAGEGRYFGLEAEVAAAPADGLHFYFWPDVVRDGYAWVFPAGSVARVGILSYRGRSSVGAQLAAFLQRLGLPSGRRHGGFLGVRLVAPVVDGVFVVGDAAGQCLPFTGEGIRSAVWAGRVCGALLRRALDGEISVSDAATRYVAYAARERRRYRVLEWSTRAALTLPARVLGVLAAAVARPGLLRAFMRHYLAMFA
jgi:flavin-dependent dehydrogenase